MKLKVNSLLLSAIQISKKNHSRCVMMLTS